jgi:3-oxoadipate enol-lactonase
MTPPLPLILLHPYPTDATFWDGMRRHLDPERPIISVNAPGFGDQPPSPGWTIDGAAAQVAAHIDTQTPNGTAAVLGLSMGGYIALSLAAHFPGRCARLVLADTRADPDDPATRAARIVAIAAIRAGHHAEYLAALLPRLLGPGAPPQIHRELAVLAERQSPAALVGALSALAARPDRRPDLRHLDMPTLVIVGAEDQVTPPRAARELAREIPHAQLVEIAGTGHLSALERPDTVAQHVEAFLARDPTSC